MYVRTDALYVLNTILYSTIRVPRGGRDSNNERARDKLFRPRWYYCVSRIEKHGENRFFAVINAITYIDITSCVKRRAAFFVLMKFLRIFLGLSSNTKTYFARFPPLNDVSILCFDFFFFLISYNNNRIPYAFIFLQISFKNTRFVGTCRIPCVIPRFYRDNIKMTVNVTVL